MKKKILIFIIIILISFISGIAIHSIFDYYKNKQIEKQYSTITGFVDSIYLDIIYLIPEDENIKEQYPIIQCSTTSQNQNFVVGDIVKIKYLPNNLNSKGIIKDPILEITGKARLFKSNIQVPVSNSTSPAGFTVFKPFNISNQKLNLNNFYQQNDLYLKKIISYDEYLKYKKEIPELRDLTVDDFVNYYLIILVSKDTNCTYTFEKSEINDDYLDLRIFKNKSLTETQNNLSHTGIAIILPNNTDFPIENIRIINPKSN